MKMGKYGNKIIPDNYNKHLQLKVVRLSSGGGRPAIFIDGGIHAREWISPATAAYLAKQLVERKTSVLANFDVYILALANPDG